MRPNQFPLREKVRKSTLGVASWAPSKLESLGSKHSNLDTLVARRPLMYLLGMSRLRNPHRPQAPALAAKSRRSYRNLSPAPDVEVFRTCLPANHSKRMYHLCRLMPRRSCRSTIACLTKNRSNPLFGSMCPRRHQSLSSPLKARRFQRDHRRGHTHRPEWPPLIGHLGPSQPAPSTWDGPPQSRRQSLRLSASLSCGGQNISKHRISTMMTGFQTTSWAMRFKPQASTVSGGAQGTALLTRLLYPWRRTTPWGLR